MLLIQEDQYGQEIDKKLLLRRLVFVNQFIARIEEKYPHLLGELTRDQLKRILLKEIEQAKSLGFSERGATRLYLDFVVLLGHRFSTDPCYAYIPEILQTYRFEDQIDLGIRIHQATEDYWLQVEPDSYYHWHQIKHGLSVFKQHTFRKKYTYYAHGVDDYISKQLAVVHPKKYAQLSKEALTDLLLQGKEKAATVYRVTEDTEIAYIIILMFIFGHEFNSDPFLPWADPQNMKQFGLGTRGHLEKGVAERITHLIDYHQNLRGANDHDKQG